MLVLHQLVNPLTAWMTFATFVGYAVIYTIFLKPNTPQNIVIGGLSGAMPPALGWAAVTGDVPAQAWILVLIISKIRLAYASRHTWSKTNSTTYIFILHPLSSHHHHSFCNANQRMDLLDECINLRRKFFMACLQTHASLF
jgi:hypothetical protein